MMRSLIVVYLCLFAVMALACGGARTGPGEVESVQGQRPRQTAASFRVETIVSNLEVPWSIVWAPDGRMFFTERPGRIRVYEKGELRTAPVLTVSDVEQSGESGLMSMALHPSFATNRWIYLAYTFSAGGQRVRVVRYRETPSGLVERTVIVDAIPAARFHAGCRIRFGPDSKLYITTGDATERSLAQRVESLAGKTLRVNDDGTVPSDNPFVNQGNARPEIWSIGHRNAQGLDWQPGTNLMFQTEHGPSGFDGPEGGDEVNVVEKGKNYGWPLIHHDATHAGMEPPLLTYTPACAPGSGAFYGGSQLPQFKNNFFFGCLRGTRLIRVVLEGKRVLSQEDLLEGKYGRIRDVAEGPDGYLYFSTSNRDGRGSPASDDDRILRLVPLR